MTVAPLQLPPIINVPQLNFSGLNAIGDALAGYRQRSALAAALPDMLGQQQTQQSTPQPQQPGNSLATLGQPQPAQPQQPSTGNAQAAIAGIESGGNYGVVGPVTGSGDRAYGKYQVMGANIPEWTKQVLGKSLTPQQFLADPQAQDAVFNAKFGQYAQKYGPEGAARAWFAGEGGMNDLGRKDQLGTSVGDYGKKFSLAFNDDNAALPAAVTTGSQPSAVQPAATQVQQPTTTSGQTIPPDTMARIQSMIRAGGPAQQFAMALLQKYVVPQQPVVVGEGAVAVNPVTGQVIARGQPKSYAVQAGGELVTPGAPGQGGAPGQTGAPTYQNTNGLMSDQAIALQANRAMNGDSSVFAQTGRGNIGQINNGKIIEYMASHGATPEALNAAKASLESQVHATQAFGTGKQGDVIRSFDVAVDHLTLLRNLAQEMTNGAGTTGFRPSNALVNAFRREFGYDLPTNFDAAKHIVAGELTKAIVGSSGALGDREELAAPLNAANSWQQLSGVIDKTYLPLMAGQMHGLQRQYEYTTKKSDFQSRLSERTRDLLNGKGISSPTVQKVTTSADANSAIAAARAAIAQGADPKAVNARLQQMGVPPLAGQ